jgi:hypothetical protein
MYPEVLIGKIAYAATTDCGHANMPEEFHKLK